MTREDPMNAQEALDFVEAISLPATPEAMGLEGDPLNILPPDFLSGIDQTVTVGSQIAGFASSIDPDMRPHISNTFLLAQLAANKHLEVHGGSSRDWYEKYIDVLKNIGWVVEGDADATQSISGVSLQVHKEIIPVITAALGPAAAAASTIVAVLNGLDNMDETTPWITLFSRESRRASANQFQVSYASVEGGMPRIKLIGFELDASKSVTQVLFFKFSSSEATLKHFDLRLSIDTLIFDSVKDAIQVKISGHVQDYVAAIEI